ncbi:RF-PROK-I domain-containing protein [Aphelenchoides bicaudatus]|nr:RF-PROK-I domain-containing protein [Aphelenchoides bicaudatus]
MFGNSGFCGLRLAFLSTSRSTSNWANGSFPTEYFKKKLVRSSGPGGQNVNKIATKVELRFNVNTAAEWLEKETLERFIKNEKSRISKVGDYVIASDKTRKAIENEEDAYEKLRQILLECARQIEFENREPTEEDVEVMNKKVEVAEIKRRKMKDMLKTKRQFRSKNFSD